MDEVSRSHPVNAMIPDDIVTLADAGALLGISPTTLRHQVKVGRLAARLIGKRGSRRATRSSATAGSTSASSADPPASSRRSRVAGGRPRPMPDQRSARNAPDPIVSGARLGAA